MMTPFTFRMAALGTSLLMAGALLPAQSRPAPRPGVRGGLDVRPNQRALSRLRVKPTRVAPGDTFTLFGMDFGNSQKGYTLFLEPLDADRSDAPVRAPIYVERWSDQAIEARIPPGVRLAEGTAAVVLLDPDRRVAGRALIAVIRGEPNREDDDRKSQARGGAAAAYPPYKGPYQGKLRFEVRPNRVARGDILAVAGGDFGDDPNGRALYLQPLGWDSQRGPQARLRIERWSRGQIEVRVPRDIPPQYNELALMMVDPDRRVLGRATVRLVDSDKSVAGKFPGYPGSRRQGSVEYPPDPGGGKSGRGAGVAAGKGDPGGVFGSRIGGSEDKPDPRSAGGTSRAGGLRKEDYPSDPAAGKTGRAKGAAAGSGVFGSRMGGSEDQPDPRSAGGTSRAGGLRKEDYPSDPGAGKTGRAGGAATGAGVFGSRMGGGEDQPDPRSRPGGGSGSGVFGSQRGGTEVQPDPRSRPGGDPTQAGGGGLAGRAGGRDRPGGPYEDRRQAPFRVALALGGGGSKGSFQLGVLKNLYARGLSPSIITGTSVGALNGAKLAEGPGAIDELVGLWRDITGNSSIYVEDPHLTSLKNTGQWFTDFSHIGASELQEIAKIPQFASRVEGMFLDFNAPEGFMLQRGLAEKVMRNLSPERVARSGIQLRLTAVERVSGDLRYITENGDIELQNGTVWLRGRTDGSDLHDDVLRAPSVADGVMASSAIPLFFTPWLMQGGESYWDGAVREGIAVRKALELGATDLVAILTSPQETLTVSRPNKYLLTIEGVRRIGGDRPDSDSQGDYYAQVKWGHRDWDKTGYYTDDNHVLPNWRFEGIMGDIQIRIRDNDSGAPGLDSDDDTCDASPAEGRRTLQINFDPRRGNAPIDGDVHGQIGDLIVARGQGDRDPVEVRFRITPGVGSSSGYLNDVPIDVHPLSLAMTLMMHELSEVGKGDLADLDTLDVLHEIAGELGELPVTRAVRSFPLPKDRMGQSAQVPNYVLIEPPVNFGELQNFDPEEISFNIEMGETVARWTRIDFLDRRPTHYDPDSGNGLPVGQCREAGGGRVVTPTQRPEASNEAWLEQCKRAAVLGSIQARIERWREVERRGDDTGRIWREKYEALQTKLQNLQIRPPRRSHRGGRSASGG